MIHYTKRVEGVCPVAIYVDFKSLVAPDKIEIVRENVEDIFAKYFDTFDVDIDSSDEGGVDLSANVNLSGRLEYWSGDRDNPPEEEIEWTEDYESILPKIKDEIAKLKNIDHVSVFDGEIDDFVVEE